MGKRRGRTRQPSMWVASTDLPRSAGHPFYQRLNRVLNDAGFDAFVEEQCATFYADGVGRPSLAPGCYVRMLLLGYFEGLDWERAMAWRAADSLSLRQFLDIALHEASPDHSTVSRTRRRIDAETHLAVFTWVRQRLADAGLARGKTVGIDATTLEANAALRSIVRRDTSEGYETFLRGVGRGVGHCDTDACRAGPLRPQASEEGLQRRLDASAGPGRDDHPHEGRPHASGAQGRARGRPGDQCGRGCHRAGCRCRRHEDDGRDVDDRGRAGRGGPAGRTGLTEVVGDTGYHSNETLVALAELGIRSDLSEPDRGRRRWRGKPAARAAVYANRRRIRGTRGQHLLRQRGERLERPHAHLYETGRLRRVHLRGHSNVLKRLLVHVCGSNLGLLMRELTGVGTPRSLQGCAGALLDALIRALSCRWRPVALPGAARPFDPRDSSWIAFATQRHQLVPLTLQGSRSATACDSGCRRRGESKPSTCSRATTMPRTD